VITPMLCFDAKGDLSVVPRDGDWVMEPKLDGWRWQVHILATEPDHPNWVRSYGGRNGAEHATPPHIEAVLAELPVGTVLDGELVTHGTSSQVSTAVSNGGKTTTFVVFDILMFEGRDLMPQQWQHRRRILERLDPAGPVTVTPVLDVNDDTFTRWLDLGLEGAVCKRRASTYRPGKRGRDWLKIKPQSTADAIVIGWKLGRGQSNQHKCGALMLSLQSGVETTVAYHCPPAEADLMVGRLVEFKHHGIMASGKPRHPVFLRTREDLEPAPSGRTAIGRSQVAPVVEQDRSNKIDLAAIEREYEALEAQAGENEAFAEEWTGGSIPDEGRGGGEGVWHVGKERVVAEGSWLRNYGAMGDKKLLKVLAELQNNEGSSVQRVLDNGGSISLNIETARRVAEGRGLV
jgi:hypothetical protein